MKTKLFFIQVLIVMLPSCKKVDGPYTTSFQFACIDELTGDTLPNVPFSIAGGSNTESDFSASTNAYGNFDTVFMHRSNSNFNIGIYEYDQYLTILESGDIIGGTHNNAFIKVIPLTNLYYEFDCSGTGNIQNVKHERLFQIPANYNYYQQASQSIVNVNCAASPAYSLFSGDWLITYEHRPSIGAPFITYKDTITLVPGEDFYYTIAE